MKPENTLKILGKYLFHHCKSFGLTLLFFLLFIVMLFLYSLPFDAVLYWGILCGSCGLVAVTIDFIFYRKKHIRLLELQKTIYFDLTGLPAAKNLVEQDYQQLIRLLDQEKTRLITKAQHEEKKMSDYYTLWTHQIKTPLAAMRLLAQENAELPQSQELLAELFKTEQYVDMALQYLRVESEYTDYHFNQCELADIVRKSVRKFAPLFIRKRIALQLDDFSCMVLTDEKWLAFVIGQLLSNSLKYTKAGSISVYLLDPQRKILAIEDTGIGIRQEDLPRVFDKSFTGSHGQKSTGLGLYLCREVMKRLSHRIRIESQVGKGTRVLLELDTVTLERE